MLKISWELPRDNWFQIPLGKAHHKHKKNLNLSTFFLVQEADSMLIIPGKEKPQIYFYINKTGLTKERTRDFLTINFSFNHMGGFKKKLSLYQHQLRETTECYYRQQWNFS